MNPINFLYNELLQCKPPIHAHQNPIEDLELQYT